jgi:hypothetical protein
MQLGTDAMGICGVQALQGARTSTPAGKQPHGDSPGALGWNSALPGARCYWAPANQLICAIWAKLIGFDDFTFAVGAGGWRLHLQLGQKLKRAPTDFVQ